MSSYSLTTRNDGITVSTTDTTYTVTIDGQTFTSTLSSVGAQGPTGTHVTGASVNVSNELVFTLSNATEINVGNLLTILGIKPLAASASLDDVELGTLSTGLIQGGNF